MKFLLIPPLIVMIIAFNAGCSMFVDNNETKQISVVESQDKKNEMAKVDNHLIAAKEALFAGDYTKAIEEATASIKDNPNSSEAYSVRGFATALHGDTAKGLADTKKAYDLDPNSVANYYNMAMVYKLQGQLNDSKQWFEKVLEKDPSNTWSVYGIATIMQTKGMILRPLIGLKRRLTLIHL